MKKNKNIISLADRKVSSALEGVDKVRKQQNLEAVSDELLNEAIREAVTAGDVNLFSLAKTLMDQADAMDRLETKFAQLSMYVIITNKENRLKERNYAKSNSSRKS